MSNFFYFLVVFLLVFITTVSYAQQELGTSENAKQTVESIVAEPLLVKQAPEVGKHVMANTDAGSMILSLLMVLAVIVITALVLKRFNVTQQNSGQLKVVASLSFGVNFIVFLSASFCASSIVELFRN